LIDEYTRECLAIRAAGLRQLNFRFNFEGSKVIFDVVSRDGRLAHIKRQNQSLHKGGRATALHHPV